MFSKILIANRGEIAVRIIRACKEMGVATVAVYSEADKNALHVALADQSYCIGGPEASESYLNENQIISTAILAGAQAIAFVSAGLICTLPFPIVARRLSQNHCF